MPEDEKRMYKRPVEDHYIKDDGNFIVLDYTHISFLQGVNGFRIPKNYLSRELRSRFLKWDESPDDERLDDYLRRIFKEIVNNFDDEMKQFEDFLNTPQKYIYFYVAYAASYISYVLKSELCYEYDRILERIWNIEEDDDDIYFDRLKHDVEFPNETEEERKERETRFREFLKSHSKTDDSDKGEINNANDAE